MDPSASSTATGSATSGVKRRGRPLGNRNKPKVPARWAPGVGGPLHIRAPPHSAANRAAPVTSIALTLWGPAPGDALNTPSPVAAATLSPRPTGSINRALREVEATLGPLPPPVDDPGPQEVAPPATRVVATPRRLAAEMLGPLIALGSRFLELLVVVEAWSFISLRLPDAVRRVIYAPAPPLTSSSERAALPPSLGVGGHSPWATVSASVTTSSSASSWRRWRPRCGSSPPVVSAAPSPSLRQSKGAALLRRSSREES
jgi:hypothetical protein